jgi:hypothetical protein
MSGKSISFAPKKSKLEQRAENEADLTKEQVEYRNRARQERKRFVNATDTEFWLCLCFRSLTELDSWHEKFGFGSLHELVKFEEAREWIPAVNPAEHKLQFGSGVSFGGGIGFEKTPDPLACVKYTGDMEADCLAELEALQAVLVTAKSPRKLRNVTDSDIWFALVFPDRDAKDKFLKDHDLVKLGDKYMDGAAVAKQFGVSF